MIRNTLIYRGYLNLLAGKEFKIGSQKETSKNKKFISIDTRLTAAGGQRYTPVDTTESNRQHTTIYFDSQAFTKQFPNYFRADIRIAFRIDNRRYSQEWAIDIQNLTNHNNPLFAKYNQKTGKIDLVNQLGIFPMVQYKIIF